MMVPPKKLLCIVQLPPPWHGVSVMNAYVINNPLLAGHYQARVLHMYFGQTLDDLGTVNARKLGYFFLFFIRMFRELVFRRPGIVYFTFMPRGINLYRDTAICLFIKFFGYQPLIHLHGRGIKEFAEKSRFKKFLFRAAFRNSQLISLSHTLTADVSNVYNGVPRVLANGIEAPEYASQHPNHSAVPVILFFSNLFVAKGIFEFLNMLKALYTRQVAFQSVIAGGNGDVTKEQVMEFCRNHGFADKVNLLGSVTGDNKWAIFQQADIFVQPSHNECFPLTVLEAMSAALPIVVTRIGGTPDIVSEGENGFLINLKDEEKLLSCVEELVKNQLLRQSMAQSSLALYKRYYTLEKFQKGFLELLNQVSGQANGSGTAT